MTFYSASIFAASKKSGKLCSILDCSDAKKALKCLRTDLQKMLNHIAYQKLRDHKILMNLEDFRKVTKDVSWSTDPMCLRAFCLFGCNTDDCRQSKKFILYCRLVCSLKNIQQCTKVFERAK